MNQFHFIWQMYIKKKDLVIILAKRCRFRSVKWVTHVSRQQLSSHRRNTTRPSWRSPYHKTGQSKISTWIKDFSKGLQRRRFKYLFKKTTQLLCSLFKPGIHKLFFEFLYVIEALHSDLCVLQFVLVIKE